MKARTLPVKRRPMQKGILHRLSAVTKTRRQRVAAAGTAAETEMDIEERGSKISRALTIIFLFHIVAIGLIFFHQRFLDRRPSEATAAPAAAADARAEESTPPSRRTDLPRFTSGEKPYIVRTGDNYARIAAAEEVDEGDLREINGNIDISTGLILKIPPKRIVAVEPPEVIEIRQHNNAIDDRGLVEAIPVDVSNAPRAQLVRPNTAAPNASAGAPADSGSVHVVKPGDTIFAIASRYKVDQNAIMRLNNIADPRKMKIGMTLRIPQP